MSVGAMNLGNFYGFDYLTKDRSSKDDCEESDIYNSTRSFYDSIEERIEFYKNKCSIENWGGEGEASFDRLTIKNINFFKEIAFQYLEYTPDISVTNDGQLSLEWEGSKFTSMIRINKFGLLFLKTLKDQIDTDESSEILSFSNKSRENLDNSLSKIFLQINDKEAL
ncbi:MAG: hypothetical protein LBL00_01290 [Endomicrobium sp.]|jgi:hypothetical protein|nr:hypothetical protein [Endomicrobium sp.]